jgi:hypothetical protein
LANLANLAEFGIFEWGKAGSATIGCRMHDLFAETATGGIQPARGSSRCEAEGIGEATVEVAADTAEGIAAVKAAVSVEATFVEAAVGAVAVAVEAGASTAAVEAIGITVVDAAAEAAANTAASEATAFAVAPCAATAAEGPAAAAADSTCSGETCSSRVRVHGDDFARECGG